MRNVLQRAGTRAALRAQGPPRTDRETLVQWVRAHLSGRRIVVVSNREPWSHHRDGSGIRVVRNAGGLTVALDAVMQATGGTWVAHGSGDADRDVVDERDSVACPPARPSYRLRRLWLGREDHARYYSGFANGALWPLCHVVYVRPRFRLDDFERYVDVNRRFADAVLEEIGDEPALVLLQDYHLALAAKFLRERRPDLQIAMFWHVPWPNPEVFRVLPWKRELLEGLLANDLLGFHIRRHAVQFLEAVADTLEARVDDERLAVERGGRRTWVRPFPISIDAEEIATISDSAECRRAGEALREQHGLNECRVGLGVDRMDYTKGIPERLLAIEFLLESRPEWRGRFAFVQIAVPSRIELSEYRRVQSETRRLVRRINARFPRAGGPTVLLIEANLDFGELVPWYRIADVCAVTSLHDGMNLVAKEYVAACTDGDGALVLSPFTGAARELERAWIASPYDREQLAGALHAALVAAPEERLARMGDLRETVLRRNVFDWTLDMLDTFVELMLRGGTAPGGVAP
ncbi:MAG: trehalose-6-phosphate synthase [Candidatus Eisenbacteria bacterium]